ncbi:hypothetical protein [Stenotrophomonas maltophilia]|uniref:hypothetical protein n=1 Tax=Stenotrophomonas maltophilia TaxID=40324 RepID=UPI0012DB19BB|nr:hypothetical protein [Stenotrophomonas maltophilia]
MNAATVQLTRHSWLSRRTIIIASALTFFPILLYAYVRGPLTCTTGCSISTPQADYNTTQFLRDIVFRDTLPFMAVPLNATYTVCNATQCADYKRNNNGDFIGGNVRPAPARSGGGGGGGGVSGDFGGMGGGGGWWDGGTGGGDPFSGKGTVIVSDPTTVQ